MKKTINKIFKIEIVLIILLLFSLSLKSQTPSRGAKDNLVHQFRGLNITDTLNSNNIIVNHYLINTLNSYKFLKSDSNKTLVSSGINTNVSQLFSGLHVNLQNRFNVDTIYNFYPQYYSISNASNEYNVVGVDSIYYSNYDSLISVIGYVRLYINNGAWVSYSTPAYDGTFIFDIILPVSTKSNAVYSYFLSYQNYSYPIIGYGQYLGNNRVRFYCNGNLVIQSLVGYFQIVYKII